MLGIELSISMISIAPVLSISSLVIIFFNTLRGKFRCITYTFVNSDTWGFIFVFPITIYILVCVQIVIEKNKIYKN